MDKVLTIAIPTYNRAKYGNIQLRSIANQYDDKLEALMSDNGGKDVKDGAEVGIGNVTVVFISVITLPGGVPGTG